MKNKFIKNLNINQQKAVLNIIGPIRIIAGAGSGKTLIIINKIAHLIKYVDINPQRICTVTFSNKAANEIKKRIIILIKNNKNYSFITTYHALCVKILREDITYLNYNSQFNIIDETDQNYILHNIYKMFDFEYNIQEIKIIKNLISNWKNNFISPNTVKISAINNSEKQQAKIYENYENYLQKINSFDFNDLILLTYKLFKNNLEILKKWQNRFDYFLIDEFQDTNELQFNIIRLLINNKQNITIVGDPDQTIYSWRGAKINLILNFHKYFSQQTQTIFLNENYRSTKNILSLANNLIIYNNNRIKKNLFTIKPSGKLPILYHAINNNDESDFVAYKIKTLINNKNYNFNDILILYRANYLSRNLEISLINYNISYHVFGTFKFYKRKEIKYIIFLLKIIINNDILAIEWILLLTPKIGIKSFKKIKQILIKQKITFTTLLKKYFYLLSLNLQNNLKKLQKIILLTLTLLPTCKTVKSLLIFISKETNYLRSLYNKFKEKQKENILKLISLASKFDKQNNNLIGIKLLNKYLQSISLQTENFDDNILNNNVVKLMTIHNAKGLEKKVVFIIGLNEGIFPTTQAIKNGFEKLEEERRILYVAITRAKELLFLSYASGLSVITGNKLFKSQFIKNLKTDFYKKINNKKIFNKQKKILPLYNNENNYKIENIFNIDKNNKELFNFNLWKINDKVKHEIFGIGIIVKIIAKNIQIVFSNPYNTKIISNDNKAIKKIK